MAGIKNWRKGFTKDELLALDTAAQLRSMGTTEKTIIRSFGQSSKETLLLAMFKMADLLDGKAEGDSQDVIVTSLP